MQQLDRNNGSVVLLWSCIIFFMLMKKLCIFICINVTISSHYTVVLCGGKPLGTENCIFIILRALLTALYRISVGLVLDYARFLFPWNFQSKPKDILISFIYLQNGIVLGALFHMIFWDACLNKYPRVWQRHFDDWKQNLIKLTLLKEKKYLAENSWYVRFARFWWGRRNNNLREW